MKKFTFILFCSVFCLLGCKQKTGNNIQEKVNPDNSTEISDKNMNEIYERTGDEFQIIAIMTVKPEVVRDILPIFEAVVIGSQEEEGCISYNLHQDINDPTKFVMVEEWESQKAIDFHRTTEHYKAFKNASKDLIIKTEVSILKLVY